jgi:replicative DNA helicase
MPSVVKSLDQATSALEAMRTPPHSVEAEQAVLGGLMLDNSAWEQVADRIAEEDYYRTDHRLIFRAMAELSNQDKPFDAVTLSEWLQARGQLEQAGGLAYLATLVRDTPTAENVKAYADIVRERAVLRQLIRVGGSLADAAYRPEGRSTVELVDFAEKSVFEIAERGDRMRRSYVPISQLMSKAMDRLDTLLHADSHITGVATGLSKFDEMTAGLQPGDLVIVAGRPSMGKCLAEDTEITLEDGSITTIAELCTRRDGRISTLKPDMRLEWAEPSAYIDDGLKPVFEVTTRLGRRVETTLTHPFLTADGWKPLAELQPGDYIAVPRQLPVFGHQDMRECEIKLLAYLIGDGGLTGSSPRFTNTNPEIQSDFAEAVSQFGGLSLTDCTSPERAASWAVVKDSEVVRSKRIKFGEQLRRTIAASGRSARSVALELDASPASFTQWQQGVCVPGAQTFDRLCRVFGIAAAELTPSGLAGCTHNGPSPLVTWLRALGLDGKGAALKFVPAAVFTLPKSQLALFTNRLFATDGWATVLASGQAQIGYSSVSERLARQLQHLLLRFGVTAKLKHRWVKYKDTRRSSWQLDVTDADSIRRFADEIGIFSKEKALAKVLRALGSRRYQSNTDLLPMNIWTALEAAKGDMSWSELARKAGVQSSNIHAYRRRLSRSRLARFAMVLDAPHLMALAHSDVYWDRIETCIGLGTKQVYDLTIPETHNFIANDVCVHNTSFAMNIAENAAIGGGVPTAIFSMEMSGEQLAMRMISSLGRIDQQKVRTGKLDDTDWKRVSSAISLMSRAPVFIDDTGGLAPTELRARARRLKRDHNLGLMVVDYLQLMQVPGTRENRATEISEICRSLKSLARELKVPVIALSQLNRSLEQRDDKRPIMSDLRESGSIEQDADLIVFIYRDEVYNKDTEDKGVAEIIIGKQRNGPTGTVRSTFLGQFTRFENYASEDGGGFS